MSLGTIKTSEDRISRAIDAVRDQSVSLILAAGPAFKTIAGADRPPNVFAAKWLPLVQLMPRADVMICHGGISTIHECIQAGLPMLVYPFKNVLDQNGNAARVLGNGLGLVGDERDTSRDMWQRIRQLLDAPGYRQRCSDMSRVFAQYGADEDLAAFLKQCTVESRLAGRIDQ